MSLHIQYYSKLERQLQNRSKELRLLSPSTCLEFLEVDLDYRLQSNGTYLPYQRAIDELSSLPQRPSIEEKLTCTVRYYQLIR